MSSKNYWNDEDFSKIGNQIENAVLTNQKEFLKLQKIYNFMPVSQDFSFIDKKWKMCVAKVIKNHIIGNDYDILFNKDWLRQELFRTNSETVLNFCKNNIQCTDLYQEFMNIKNREKNILKSSLQIRDFEHELDKIITE